MTATTQPAFNRDADNLSLPLPSISENFPRVKRLPHETTRSILSGSHPRPHPSALPLPALEPDSSLLRSAHALGTAPTQSDHRDALRRALGPAPFWPLCLLPAHPTPAKRPKKLYSTQSNPRAVLDWMMGKEGAAFPALTARGKRRKVVGPIAGAKKSVGGAQKRKGKVEPKLQAEVAKDAALTAALSGTKKTKRGVAKTSKGSQAV